LLDYYDIIIHIFSEESRRFYNIEKIWSDGDQISPDSL
jgi:ribosome-associated protein